MIQPLGVRHLKFAPPSLAVDQLSSTCFHSEKYGHRMLALQLARRMNILGIALTVPKAGRRKIV